MVREEENIKFLETLDKSFDIGNSIGIKMIELCELIKKSNEHFNLTSITKLEDMLSKHIFDSLSIKHLVSGKNILDIGSGAGLPGIPLALSAPDSNFFLLDSNNKKIIFLNHVKISLEIENIFPKHDRVENFDSDVHFDTIVCRSYASLAKIYLNSKKYTDNGGKIIAMKGKMPKEEIAELKKVTGKVDCKIEKLMIPGLAAERHAVIIN
tara:strand:+ start:269 stop:898 length:630 start_codon:yes stop_codon:yes gene_type:complete